MENENKKSSDKSKVFSLLLIPLFLVFGAIVIDTGISMYQSHKLKSDTESFINEVVSRDDLDYTEYENEIRRIYERYNYETDMLVVSASSNKIYVENEHKYSGIFTSLFYKSKEENIEEKKILGIPFHISKNSKAFVKVEATIDDKGNINFEYVE